jgi:hypothetical protein
MASPKDLILRYNYCPYVGAGLTPSQDWGRGCYYRTLKKNLTLQIHSEGYHIYSFSFSSLVVSGTLAIAHNVEPTRGATKVPP